MAMACRFELVLQGADEPWLRAVGEEALREIERLEAQLSIFRPDSDVSRINARAAREPVRVEPRLFQLLQLAMQVHRDTAWAFDLTVGPLMRAWGFYGEGGRKPSPAELAGAQARTGMDLIELDARNRTVQFLRDGLRLDFGAIGKGYAIDEAVAILRESGVERAFLHGGTSTMYGLGRPIDAPAWTVLVPHPSDPDHPLGQVSLTDRALSVSAVWGKSFVDGDATYGHVIDPRLGHPVRAALLAAAASPSATISDAVSTALLVRGRPHSYRDVRSLVVRRSRRGRETVLDAGLLNVDSRFSQQARTLGDERVLEQLTTSP